MLVLLLQYNTCSSQLKAVLIRGICKVSTRNVQLADPLPCSPQLLGFPPLYELFIIALFLYILLSALYIALPIFNPQRPRAKSSVSSILWDPLFCAWEVLWAECQRDYRIIFPICLSSGITAPHWPLSTSKNNSF